MSEIEGTLNGHLSRLAIEQSARQLKCATRRSEAWLVALCLFAQLGCGGSAEAPLPSSGPTSDMVGTSPAGAANETAAAADSVAASPGASAGASASTRAIGAAGTGWDSGTMTGPTASGSDAAAAGSGAVAAGSDPATAAAGAEAPGTDSAAAAGAMGVASGAAGSVAMPAGPMLPAVTSTDGPGPFQTTQDLRSGPRGQSGLFRPQELGKDGLLHPVFVWGCGGMATPSSYASELTQIASHGFVVIAEVENIGDDGAPLLAALDWIVAENERPDSQLYHKLNTSRVGLGGHSIGSVNSFFAGTDPRWTTTMHVAGGSLDDVNDISAPTTGKGGKALIHPTAYICSASDLFGNVEKAEKDYENTTVPVFFTILAGAEHIGVVGEALPVIIAWLRWQLGDEEARRPDFLDPMGMFSTGRYMTRTKNW